MKAAQNPLREPLRGHDLIVARSRALHRAVAEKIPADEALIEVARANVNRWIAQEEKRGRVSPALLEWKKWMEERIVEETLELICGDSEEADRLRHASPFCGILTEEERNAIYRRYAAQAAKRT
jgi:hypothetical protein